MMTEMEQFIHAEEIYKILIIFDFKILWNHNNLLCLTEMKSIAAVKALHSKRVKGCIKLKAAGYRADGTPGLK